jgi:hypothetical protein
VFSSIRALLNDRGNGRVVGFNAKVQRIILRRDRLGNDEQYIW